jgi:diguanylate cyclase (GGDEF)-like protein
MIELAPTLFLFSSFVLSLLSALMYVIWRNDSEDGGELGWWSIAFLFASGSGLCFAFRNSVESVSVVAGNALLLWSFGFVWMGAAAFVGKPLPPLLYALGGGLIWLSGLWSAEIHFRISAVGLITAIYDFLTAHELHSYNRRRGKGFLLSQLAVWLVGTHVAADIFVALMGPFFEIDARTSFVNTWLLKYRWMGLFSYFAVLGFVLVTLSKERAANRQEAAAMIDPLTGLANRRAFERAFERAMKHATENEATALLVFDFDNFKEINDRFGHPVGDRVLAAFGKTAARNIRSGDVLARIGGEEFAALLCPVDRETALAIAERIRVALIEEVSQLTEGLATVSVGVAVVEDRRPDLKEMTATADKALYQAKAAGRNRVVLAGS